MQFESAITQEMMTDLQEKIVFLERELADAARDEIALHEVIINLKNKIQVLEQEYQISKPTPYQY